MSNIKVFEDRKVRTQWDAEKEDWWFSVVDIVGILTDKDYEAARKYWKVLKGRLKNEGSELVSFCYQLKLQSSDGKYYNTDVLDTKGVLRLVQSIPSKKAEPFKMWLAQVGSDRLDEIADPEKAIIRGADFYRAKGYTEGWINQRLQTIEMRKELTDEWKERGVTKDKDYAIITNEMTKAWSGLSAVKSEIVDAPIVNEFPICMECEFIEYQSNQYGCGVVGKIVHVTADEKVMKDDKVDVSLLNAIAFDPYTHGYYKVTERVGEAFKDGFKLKK